MDGKIIPMITPPEVARAIQPMVEGKTICDLGCHKGEFLRNFENCKKIGITIRKEDIPEDMDIIHGNYFNADIPEADVYYNFTYSYDMQKLYNRIPKGKIVIFGKPIERFDEPEAPRWIIKHPVQIDIPFKPTESHLVRNPGHVPLKRFIWRLTIIQT
jgi:hypothetical protein